MPVEIDGAVELKAALERFTPDLAYNMEKHIEKALVPIVKEARDLVPAQATLSTWAAYSSKRQGSFPFFNSLQVKAGIKYTTEPTKPNRKGFSYAAMVYNSTASGAIYETAGRKNPYGRPVNPYAGKEKDITDINPELLAAYQKKLKNKKYSRSTNPNAGRQFIQSMPPLVDARNNKMRGRRGRNMKGRLIYKAWKHNNGKAYDAVNFAIQDAINEFKKRSVSKRFTTVSAPRKAA